MITFDALCLEIQNKRSVQKMSWQKIGDAYGINKAMARLIALGYEPKRKVRRILDLAPSATVVVFGDGMVPDGTQTIRASQCSCGQWFIPNHPARTHCFLCRPARGKKVPTCPLI